MKNKKFNMHSKRKKTEILSMKRFVSKSYYIFILFFLFSKFFVKHVNNFYNNLYPLTQL